MDEFYVYVSDRITIKCVVNAFIVVFGVKNYL